MLAELTEDSTFRKLHYFIRRTTIMSTTTPFYHETRLCIKYRDEPVLPSTILAETRKGSQFHVRPSVIYARSSLLSIHHEM